MTVSDLLEQPCNKSDHAINLVTSCKQFFVGLHGDKIYSFVCGNIIIINNIIIIIIFILLALMKIRAYGSKALQ